MGFLVIFCSEFSGLVWKFIVVLAQFRYCCPCSDDASISGGFNSRTNESETNSRASSPNQSRSNSTVRQEAQPVPAVKSNGKPPVDDVEDDDLATKRKKKKNKKPKTASEPVVVIDTKPTPVFVKPKAQEVVNSTADLKKPTAVIQESDKNGAKNVKKGKGPAISKESENLKPAPVASPMKRPATAPAPMKTAPQPVIESDDEGVDENEGGAGDNGADVGSDEWVQQRSKSQKVSLPVSSENKRNGRPCVL